MYKSSLVLLIFLSLVVGCERSQQPTSPGQGSPKAIVSPSDSDRSSEDPGPFKIEGSSLNIVKALNQVQFANNLWVVFHPLQWLENDLDLDPKNDWNTSRNNLCLTIILIWEMPPFAPYFSRDFTILAYESLILKK